MKPVLHHLSHFEPLRNAASSTTASMRRFPSVCSLTERIGVVRDRTRAAGWTSCIVVNDHNVVLGRVRSKALDSDPDQPVEAVMEAGPTTERPSEPLAGLVERMQQKRVSSVVVTTPDGRLVGVLRREDGEKRLAE